MRIAEGSDFPREAAFERLSASWHRCRGMHLDHDLDLPLEPVTDSQLRKLLQRDARLAAVARQELEMMSRAVADTGHVLVVIDDQGFIAAVAGDVHHAGDTLRRLRLGVDLSEASFGTTAPGTALADRQPILVRRSDHFLTRLRQLECLAAPIFTPGGDVLGVLGVCSDQRPLLPGIVEMVQSAVLRMERQLLRELGSPKILRLHPHPCGLGGISEGLIAVGKEGEILGTNTIAAQLLGITQQHAVGRSLEGFFEVSPLRLRSIANGIATLRINGGLSVAATLVEVEDLERRAVRAGALPEGPGDTRSRSPDLRLLDQLTRREIDVLRHLDNGHSNLEIARAIFVSEDTVKYHLKNIYAKLAVGSRLQAIATARELKLIR